MAVGLLHPLAHPGLLGHAAAQHNHLVGIVLLGVGQHAQVAEYPLLGVLPHGAGVQNHQIRLPRLLGEGKAAGLQHAHQALSVRHVLLAAEGIHAGHGMDLPGGKHLPDPFFKIPLAGQILRRDLYILAFQLRFLRNSYTLTKVS